MTEPTSTPDGEGLREAVKADLALLEFIGCRYFACEGPDREPEDMLTCRVCWRIRELRTLLAARPKPVPTPNSGGLREGGLWLVTEERRRQVEVEGYHRQHDYAHGSPVLSRAARCYEVPQNMPGVPDAWPWEPESWKPKGIIRNLVRAGALYLAARDVAPPLGMDRPRAQAGLDRCVAALDEIAAHPEPVPTPDSEALAKAWDEEAEAGFDSHAPDDLTDVQARNPYRLAPDGAAARERECDGTSHCPKHHPATPDADDTPPPAECGAIPPNVGGPVPCHLPSGHANEHFSTTGCKGSEIRWDTPPPAGGDVEAADAKWALTFAIIRELPLSPDGTGHVTDCGWDDDRGKCGCFTLPERIANLLKADRAAREVEVGERIAQAIEADQWMSKQHIALAARIARQQARP